MTIGGILWMATVGLWAVGFVLLARLRRRGSGAGGAGGDAASVSVIIPARNEERNLPTLLRSLAAQSAKPREIVVVDDGSTDRTAVVARELGATVIASQELPEGWQGKTWACHQGARAASGDWLLFVDADTWFEEEGLSRIVAEATGGAFSAGPYHAVRRPYESLSLFFNLAMAAGTVPDGLMGQMLLVDRESYRRVGGHEAVKGRVLENFWLAERFRAAGVRVRSAMVRGAFGIRMYPNGVRELAEGWTKGFASGAGRTPAIVLAQVVAWMSGLLLAPIGLLAVGDWLWWAPVYLACAAQVRWASRQVGSFGLASALLYPLPLVFFLGVFARSMWHSGRRVTWKGRTVRAD
ncbi:MAG TPA: glycosyltransferase family 2 protein [Verrucomicrobiota bacterium]|nr:glycosyltransferase family 2 protein [Verrucomicrobiota bacterium]